MDVRIRSAEKRDDSSICELIRKELGYPNLDKAGIEQRLAFFRESENDATFVAEMDNRIVGIIGVMKGVAYNIEGQYGQIMVLAVSKDARRVGVGRRLVQRAEEWARSCGIASMAVSSGMQRQDAHAFYEGLGYAKRSLTFTKHLE